MGGLWVDYNLMTSVPGLYSLGEANFSDHGANRLGASALMQGLADGYFVIPYTIGDYLAEMSYEKVSTDRPEFKESMQKVTERLSKLLSIKGKKTVDELHRELGLTMWEYCGMSRTNEGLKTAKTRIQELRREFWENVNVTGGSGELNMEIEKANRVADFMELGELMVDDALNRSESCGGHFREESQTPDGEARRNDDDYAYVSAWEYKGDNAAAELHREELIFENVKLTQRSYK
jgi:succinate dehydrogenase / fumarate reductase flavoprotein subunit